MNSKIKKIYDSSIKNEFFLNDIESADGDKKPNLFAGEIEKHIFSSIYYGWLVGKYGDDWESKI